MRKILLVLLILAGCATTPDPLPMPEPNKIIFLDREYFTECGDLLLLDTTKYSFEYILENVSDNAAIYRDCRLRQHNSILMLKKLTNTKDK